MLFQSNLSGSKPTFPQKLIPNFFLYYLFNWALIGLNVKNTMSIEFGEYLDSDELRLLTRSAVSGNQIKKLLKLGVTFTLDNYGCPLVRYQDAKHYFLLLGMPLPRGLDYQS
jgi:hypothetical protein